jgi:uncharacterized oligopeptide transporter (OPT) family protein
MTDPTAHPVPAVSSQPAGTEPPKFGFLPPIGSRAYYVMLAAVAIFVLGPLGGIAAAYMNFSLGFFVGGQVLAGILGSAVTYGYGAEGKHGANYMQTMAASVASMAGMAVLIQAMVWLGMPMPAAWKLMLFFCCIGMFGVGLGMLYTPILVDRLQLTYPSGLAVANILRALTDKRLLRRSIGQLGGGTGLGIAFAYAAEHVTRVGAIGLSASTVGAGMVVASRIAVPAVVMGGIGELLTPYLRSIGWLAANDPFRKIGFLIGLAMILGAAIVDLSLIGVQAIQRIKEKSAEKLSAGEDNDWKKVRTGRLIAWVLFWGTALILVSTAVLHQSIVWVLFAIALSLIFVLINGISTGISDSNPISSAFVIAVLLMSTLGLKSPVAALMAAAILLISCSVGVDMQQDRSTGWRLGTNRIIQFRYQVIGILMGAVLCVVLAQTFMTAYPVLRTNAFDNPEAETGQWHSAMTFKFVGAIRSLGHLEDFKLKALLIGLAIGLVLEITRKVVHKKPGYQRYVKSAGTGFAVGWILDAVLLASPYALSFGGFVPLSVSCWFAAGGVLTSVANTIAERQARNRPKEDDLPEDMSTTSLVGGGLIAGESLYALAVGVIGLLSLVG